MELKHILFVSSFLLSYATLATGSCSNFKAHYEIYKHFGSFGDFTVANACDRIDSIRDGLATLMIDCGLGTTENASLICNPETDPFIMKSASYHGCQRGWENRHPRSFIMEDPDENPKNCSILDGSELAPMAHTRNPPSYCSVYNGVKVCQDNNCDNAGTFTKPTEKSAEIDGNDCSEKAVVKCLDTVKDVAIVDQTTCINMAEAKTCFIMELMMCSGTTHHRLAAGLLVRGIVEFIKSCQENNIPFNLDGTLCVPNPVDTFNLDEIESYDCNWWVNGDKTTKTENCKVTLRAAEKMEKYLNDCNATTSQYNVDAVKFRLNQLNEPTNESCKKGGFTVDGYSGVGQCQASHVMTLVTSLLVLVIGAIVQ